jgi:hypothetical protein
LSLPPQIVRTFAEYAQGHQFLENSLGYPGLVDRARDRIRLRVWRYPSFEPHSSWSMIEAKSGLFLRRVIWEQRRDFTYGSETPFERPVYDKLCLDLENIEVTPFEAFEGIGLDGTRYGIERFSSFTSSKISWWESPPPGWTALQRWHQKAIEIFDSVLPMSTAGMEGASERPR